MIIESSTFVCLRV